MGHHRLIILGAGTAGLTAFKQASTQTDDILLVDPGPLGTTCARVGCMPSKALLQVARNIHASRRLHGDGLVEGAMPRVNLGEVMAQVRRLRDRFAAGPVKTVEKLGDRYLRGSARFTAPDRIEVDGRAFSADGIIVATGSRPVVPAEWSVPDDQLLTSDTLFEQDTLPSRAAVIGLGPIGLELGQALAMLGLEVHAFGLDRDLAGLSDPEINDVAFEALAETMQLHVGAEATPEPDGDAIRVRQGDRQVTVDIVIAALGRKPVVDHLNLEALEQKLDRNGMPELDPDSLRAGDAPVYFAGDVNGMIPLLHEAADEGRMAAYHALNPNAECLRRRTPLAIVFTQPEIARCGTDHANLPRDAVIGTSDFGKQGRAIIMGQQHGRMRVYADRHGVLLGAEMVTVGAEHLAHELAWLVQQGMDVTSALQLPFYHPVLEEGMRTALQDIRRQLPARERQPDLPLCGHRDDPMPGK